MSLGRQRVLIILCCVIVAGIPLLVFQDVLGFEFLNYDDDIYITGNPLIQSLHVRHIWAMFSQGYFRSYQPLTLLSHALDYAAWGVNPWGHHLTNLLLLGGGGKAIFVRRATSQDRLGLGLTAGLATSALLLVAMITRQYLAVGRTSGELRRSVIEAFSTRAFLSLGVVYNETGQRAKARGLFRDAARLGSPEAQQLSGGRE